MSKLMMMGAGRHSAAAPAFTPASITGAVWFDGTDTSVMFTDDGSTAVASDTDDCRRWDAKLGSGASAYSLKRLAGTCPAYRTGGVGVEFVGSNSEYLLGAGLPLGASIYDNAFSIYMRVTVNSSTNNYLFGEGDGTGLGGYWIRTNPSNAAQPSLIIRNDGGTYFEQSAEAITMFDNTKRTLGIEHDGSGNLAYYIGTTSSATEAYSAAESVGTDGFALGGQYNAGVMTGGRYATLNLIHFVMAPATLSTGDRASLVSFLDGY